LQQRQQGRHGLFILHRGQGFGGGDAVEGVFISEKGQ
jgi:hypothetical protein